MKWIGISFLILIIVMSPIGVHELMTIGNAVTSNDWIGFFGSYIGAIIGAMVAFFISYFQTKSARNDISKQIKEQERQFLEQIKHEKKLHIMENRTLIDYAVFDAPLILDNPVNDDLILLHYRMEKVFRLNHYEKEALKDLRAKFIKVDFYGKNNSVLDITINITLYSSEDEDIYTAVIYKSGLSNEQSIYIPLHLEDDHDQLYRVEVTYTTFALEKLRFVSDLENKIEKYYSIEDGSEILINEREIKNESYIYPYWMKRG
ncbi:hypothetical protein [Metabacillus fastidiosus]|uniref:hypothetical protein n=1 Tax=Metabacillus fastidiosus TaxID=1458 RepID=UPI003D287122